MFFDEVAYGSVVLTIDDQLLSFRHIRSDGVVTDSFQIVKAGVDVDIDIQPNRDPNAIYPFSLELIPVAIFGSDSIDVMEVDPDQLAFGRSRAALAHLDGPHFDDVDGDGFLDLVAHFRTPETGIFFGDTEACLTGEIDGNPFEACDDIKTVGPPGWGCGIGFELAFLLPPLMWVVRRRGRPIH